MIKLSLASLKVGARYRSALCNQHGRIQSERKKVRKRANFRNLTAQWLNWYRSKGCPGELNPPVDQREKDRQRQRTTASVCVDTFISLFADFLSTPFSIFILAYQKRGGVWLSLGDDEGGWKTHGLARYERPQTGVVVRYSTPRGKTDKLEEPVNRELNVTKS